MIDTKREAARLFAPKPKQQPTKHQQDAEDTWKMLDDEAFKDRYWKPFADAARFHLTGELLELREKAKRKDNPGAWFLAAAKALINKKTDHMTTQQFIEKAIEGGWKDGRSLMVLLDMMRRDGHVMMAKSVLRSALLNPDVWQAVGKAEGWKEYPSFHLQSNIFGNPTPLQMEGWRARWFQMIDALAEGKSTDQFLEDL